MKKEKLKVQYKYISGEESRRRLNEAFDLIFSKIEKRRVEEKLTLDKSILTDYNSVSLG